MSAKRFTDSSSGWAAAQHNSEHERLQLLDQADQEPTRDEHAGGDNRTMRLPGPVRLRHRRRHGRDDTALHPRLSGRYACASAEQGGWSRLPGINSASSRATGRSGRICTRGPYNGTIDTSNAGADLRGQVAGGPHLLRYRVCLLTRRRQRHLPPTVVFAACVSPRPALHPVGGTVQHRGHHGHRRRTPGRTWARSATRSYAFLMFVKAE